MVEVAEDEAAQAAGVHDRELDDDRPVGLAFDRGLGPDLGCELGLVTGVDADPHRHRAARAVLPGLVGEVGVGAEVVGDRERTGRPRRELTLDAIGAEHPHVVRTEIPPDEVPATELGREAPGLDPARAVPVRELHDGAVPGRVEQRGQRIDVGQLGDRHPARALEAPQLHERTCTLAAPAAEPDRGDGHVQGFELGLAQVEVGQVVLLRVHPVAGLVAVGVLAHRHFHRPQARLVPFEGLPGRLGRRGVAERRVADDLVAGQPGPRLEQGGQQVQQSFAAVRGVVHQVRRC